MTPELVRSYKVIFSECLTAVSDQQLPQILEHLDTIADDAEDLIEAMEGGRRGQPGHWLNLFRFIKLGQVLQKTLKESYDSIVNTYQLLSAKSERNPDEDHLLKEAGDFLYAVDEVTGDTDRLLPRLMQEIRSAMVRTYGIVLTPSEEIFSDRIPDAEMGRLDASIEQMMSLSQRMHEQVRLMHALVRIQKLILEA